jgi:hypothetical protein
MRPNVKLLSPWIEPHSPDGLELELQREVAPEHVLPGKSATALAVARDRDDVLFAVNEADSLRYAVVHLTWSGKTAPCPWPATTFFESLEQWIEWMKADHEDYTCGDE